MCAPRALASSRSSRNSEPAPSPRTKPLRVRSNGRETVCERLAGSGHAHPAHVREAGVGDLEQRRLGRAADDRDAVAAADRLGALADVVGAGRAGRHDAHVVADGAGLDGDHPGRRVDERVGDERRRHASAGPSRGASSQSSIISVWPPAPEPKTTPTSSRFSSVISKPGVGDRLLRRRHAVVHARLAAPNRLGVHPRGGVEVADLAGRAWPRTAWCRTW